VATAEAPVLVTDRADFTTNINSTSLENLPMNGRRWSFYALSTPGAVGDGGFGLVSFRGISGLLNNNTVDGADNNQAFFSEERGRTRISYSTSEASIQEFQVNTSNYSAEYGRAAGGVVNAVTKGGTNQIHGQAFWYDRNSDWGAINPFQTHLVNGVSTPFLPEDKRRKAHQRQALLVLQRRPAAPAFPGGSELRDSRGHFCSSQCLGAGSPHLPWHFADKPCRCQRAKLVHESDRHRAQKRRPAHSSAENRLERQFQEPRFVHLQSAALEFSRGHPERAGG
jgi:hypothetical protein